MQVVIRFPRLLFIFSLGFLWLITSCSTNKITRLEAKKAIFFPKLIDVPKSSLVIDFVLPYDSVLSKLNMVKGKTIVAIPETASSDPLTIDLLNSPTFSKRRNDLQISNCQLKFKAKPSIAGINAGWIEGVVKLNISLSPVKQFSKNIQFDALTYSYQWMVNPQVKVMGFPVNVSSVLDKYISSKSEFIKQTLLTRINALVDVNQWLPNIRNTLINQSLGEYSLVSKELAIDVNQILFEDKQINVKTKVEGFLGLMFKGNSNIDYNLVGEEAKVVSYYANKEDIQKMFDIFFSKKFTSGTKKLYLNEINSNGLVIEIAGLFGKKSTIAFDCGLEIYGSKIYFSTSNAKLKHIAFPYVFFKNVLRRKLFKTIENATIDITSMISSNQQYASLQDIEFKGIRMNPHGILLLGKLNAEELKIYP